MTCDQSTIGPVVPCLARCLSLFGSLKELTPVRPSCTFPLFSKDKYRCLVQGSVHKSGILRKPWRRQSNFCYFNWPLHDKRSLNFSQIRWFHRAPPWIPWLLRWFHYAGFSFISIGVGCLRPLCALHLWSNWCGSALAAAACEPLRGESQPRDATGFTRWSDWRKILVKEHERTMKDGLGSLCMTCAFVFVSASFCQLGTIVTS